MAALVIVINGYLLLDFFSAEVTGIAFTSVVCVFTAAYGAFIIYLVSQGVSFFNCRRAEPKQVLGIE